MKSLKIVIIEDELKSRELIANLLNSFCDNIEIVGKASDVEKGIEMIEKFEPELVFLDIRMPDGNGFDLLKTVRFKEFELVITTAYDEYALKAIKHSCLDYLMKPIDLNELIEAVNKAKKRRLSGSESTFTNQQVNSKNQQAKKKKNKVAIPMRKGTKFIEENEIVFCKAEGAYTEVYLKNNDRHLVSKTLKIFEKQLPPANFKRPHHSFLVNMETVKNYLKQDGGCLELYTGMLIPVSRRFKKDFLKALES